MIRLFDFVLSALGLLILSPVLLVLLMLCLLDTGAPLLLQVRVGFQQRPFTLIKFRTMKVGTAPVASHLAMRSSITPFGSVLRKTKLDELPQLWNVLVGDMSLVGPRPCLFNQTDLNLERLQRGVFDVRPGITGLAQVNAIDTSTPKLLARIDAMMIKTLSLKHYICYVIQTIAGKGAGDCVVRYDENTQINGR